MKGGKLLNETTDTLNRVDEILDGKELWARYVTSLIIDFAIQPSEAWRMSVPEYWSLHGYRFEESEGKKIKPIDHKESKDLFARLRKEGKIK